MDRLYVAVLLKKKRLEYRNIYLCRYCGVVVGLLLGSYFLSSRSLKYRPMVNYNFNGDSKLQFIDNYNFNNNFLESDDIYCYYCLEEVNDYNDLENIINRVKEDNKNISYLINLEESTPYILKYKD